MEWKLEDYRDIDTVLVFAILVINKRSNLVKWNEKKDKTELLLEVIVPWEDYFDQMKRRKSEKI